MSTPQETPQPALRTAGLPEPALAGQAIAQVLQPLARLMIGHGLQLPSMVELLKKALVDEAVGAYGLADKGSSDTRIALLTGVHRKDVKRLREAPESTDLVTPMVPVAASVVARWISEPHYLNADQSARPLARTPKRGQMGEPDFTTLVAEVSRDVGARAVLDELERLGVVSLQDDGYVALKSNAFVPKEGLSESFHFLAANVSDHLATAVHNLAPDRPGPLMLEQSAFSLDLSEAQAQQLQIRARQLWSVALQQFLQTATVAKQRSLADSGPKHRVRFGVYFHDAMSTRPAASLAKPQTIKQTKRQAKP
ncbi:MAG: DUF6502 family protein [Rhodoferax sp.]|uniref:DUF6502 family protein n=1 Tax=Rhodoferax sp. TaxID=50421 RepID=UPI0026298278|nr:DUF6502 family protein [Rhodoferax sp.]MDD2880054.1 DUF6502 family protein [Rhodoferax sp.]